jgi:hypothetical protein
MFVTFQFASVFFIKPIQTPCLSVFPMYSLDVLFATFQFDAPTLAEAILAEKVIENVASLYSLLLLEANYGNTRKQGNVLERGEIDTTLKELAQNTHTDYTRIRRFMKQLELEGLIIYISRNGRRYILLPYYEEHCGRKVRPVEQANGTTIAQNQTDKDFDLFWEFYHEMIPVTPQDRAKARKIYGRLSLNDRESAVRNVEVYYASLASEKHAKWAVNYLKDKSFIMDKKA